MAIIGAIIGVYRKTNEPSGAQRVFITPWIDEAKFLLLRYMRNTIRKENLQTIEILLFKWCRLKDIFNLYI